MSTQVEKFRDALVRQLVDAGMVRTPRVEAAMRDVPRHVFLPGVPVRQCYSNDVTATKRDADGVPISAASQPSIVGLMLEQLDVRPGMRILEIGAGTGYNAALLSHLAGPDGQVVTVDVDDDIVAGAAEALDAAGADSVTVLHGDGALGAPGFAPFDRIIATVGVWDLPTAWTEQLADGGLIVAPLRLRGSVTRSVALERGEGTAAAARSQATVSGGHGPSISRGDTPGPPSPPMVLRSRSSVMCGFMPLRASIASDPRRTVPLTPSGSVALEVQQDQEADPDRLAGVLETERVTVGTGVEFNGVASAEALYLWLTCSLPGGLYGLTVRPDAAEAGIVTPMFRWGTMAAVASGSLAYLAVDPAGPDGPDGGAREIQVIGHGPEGRALAEEVAEQVRVWIRDYCARVPEFTITPLPDAGPGPGTDLPVASTPGTFLIRTPHNLITITWRPGTSL